MPLLQAILESYHDYVNHELMFDSPPEEILPFAIWAAFHHGVEQREAQDFYLAAA